MTNDLRGEGCMKKFAEVRDNKLRIVCPRCKRFHEFDIEFLQGYNSHKVAMLDNRSKV